MAGRPRTPTHLKLVTGNPGKRPMNKAEPTAARSKLQAPDYLSPRALECWGRVAPMLDRMGVLTVADEIALGELCEAFADMIEARASLANPVEVFTGDGSLGAIAEGGSPIYTTKSKEGYMIRKRPEVDIIAETSRRFHALLGQFGMTPAARSKITLADKPAADPLDEYFGS